MEKVESEVQQAGQTEHIISYQAHFSTWAGLILLTIMTATVSIYGADLYTTAILTALVIATTKVIVVAFYFMHLKYDLKIYRILIGIALILFLVFVILTLIDYLFR